MGCFNSLGFHSKLPIQYGDDIVLIIYYGYIDSISSPIYSTDLLSPLFYPLIGKYDDYGSIENISNISVVNDIKSITGVANIYDLLKGISRCDGAILEELYEISDKSLFEKEYSEVEKVLKCIVDDSITVSERKNKIYLAYGIERLDVYRKMCELSDNIEFRKKFDNLIELRDKFSLKGSIYKTNESQRLLYNDLDSSGNLIESDATEILNKLTKYRELKELDLMLQESSIRVGNSMYCIFPLYKNSLITPDLVEDCYKFVLFNETIHKLNGYYTISPYGDQCISDFKKEFKSLNDLYSKIIDTL